MPKGTTDSPEQVETPRPKEARRRSHWPISVLSSLSAVVNVLLPLILVRKLTPDEVGLFKVFFLYLSFFPGLAGVAGIMSGLAYWAGKEKQRDRAMQVSALQVLVVGALFCAGAWGFQDWLAMRLGWPVAQVRMFAFALFGAITSNFFEEAAIATGRVWTGALFYSGFELLRTSAILVAVYLQPSVIAIFVAHAAVVSLKILSGMVFGYRLGLVRFVIDWVTLKSVWRYAFPVSVAWFFGVFVGNADQLILSNYLSKPDFALYSIGCLSLAPLYIVEQSITRVMIPQLSEAFTTNRPIRAANLYRDAVEHIAFLLVPAVAGLIVFADPIIVLLFTSRYAAAAHYLRFYALSYLLLILPYDAVARARGRAGWILHNFLIFSVFSLVLAYTLTRFYGPFGALAALLLSGLGMRLNSLWFMRGETSWPWREFIAIGPLLQFTALALLLSFGVLLLEPTFTSSLRWFFLCAPMFAVCYLVCGLLLKNRGDLRRRETSRVLFLTQNLNIGGLERMVFTLGTRLKNEGWEVSVFAYDQRPQSGGDLLGDFARAGIPVKTYDKPPGFSLPVILKLVLQIYRHDVQVVHCQDLGGLIYAVFAKIVSLGRFRLLHTQHSFIHLDRSRRYRLYEKIFTRFVDELVVVSADTLQTYVDLGFSEDRVRLITNGVDFRPEPITDRAKRILGRRDLLAAVGEAERTTLAQNENSRWLLYLARLFPRKGQEHAIELWNELPARVRQGSLLVIVGPEAAPGERARIIALIAKAVDRNRIVLIDGTNDPQAWLGAADVYLSCSEFEGMPLGPLEAVGAGLPTVLSKIPGHEFLATVSDQYSLGEIAVGAQVVTRVVDELDRDEVHYLESLWERSRWVRDQYSADEMVRRYAALFYRAQAAQFQRPSSYDVVESSVPS